MAVGIMKKIIIEQKKEIYEDNKEKYDIPVYISNEIYNADKDYKSFIIKNIKKMYKISFCLPISLIIFSIICYFFNDSNINIDLTSGLSSLSKLHLNMGIWFCIIYSINILLLSISICNLVIIIGKKSFNVFITNIIIKWIIYSYCPIS